MENKTLFHLKPSSISPNPHNPRLIFDPEGMDELKKSISKVGILVPLTVYKNTKSVPKTEYVLLDGERRWRVSNELGLNEVPVNVIDEPEDVTQNILYMFNIHHYKNEWALFPTALKLETLMQALGTDSEKELSDFTGVSRSTIRRCKQLLWIPEKYRDILMEKNGKISTDFFIELYPIAYKISYQPRFYPPHGVERFIDRMIDIFESGEFITDVKEFREIRRAMGYYEKNNNMHEFVDRLDAYISSNEPNIDVFLQDGIDSDKNRKNIIKYVSFLNEELKNINEDYMSDFSFVDDLRKLYNLLDNLLERID